MEKNNKNSKNKNEVVYRKNESTNKSHSKKKNKKNQQKPNYLIIVLIIVFAIISVALVFYYRKLNLIQYDKRDDVRYTPDYSEEDLMSDKDILNVLLLGTDERAEEFSDTARADSCMIMSLNKKTMAMKLVSLERATAMQIPYGEYAGQYDWQTHLFNYGGVDMLITAIQGAYRVKIDHYVRVNFSTFEKIIDSIGGVDIELTRMEARALNNEVYTNAVADTRVEEGLNHLSGYNALQYARLRFIDSDWQRIERQRKVIASAIDSTKNLGVSDLNNLLNNALPLVQTDFSKFEITSLLPLAAKYSDLTMEDMSLPAEGTYETMVGMEGRSMFKTDFEENSRILQEFFYGESK